MNIFLVRHNMRESDLNSWQDLSLPWMAFVIAFWKVNFSLARSWANSSTLLVVTLLFDQFKLFKTLFAQPSVSPITLTNSLSISRLFALITPFPNEKLRLYHLLSLTKHHVACWAYQTFCKNHRRKTMYFYPFSSLQKAF